MIYPPEGGEGYTADYDIELWGWGGGIDPNGLLAIFKCDAIGDSSDSQYCNPEYDKMYDDQLAAATAEERKADPRRDAEPHLRRGRLRHPVSTTRTSWAIARTASPGSSNQPANGTPFFTYSTLQYTKLTDATARDAGAIGAPASAGPSGSDVAAAPSGAPTSTATRARPAPPRRSSSASSPSWRSWPSGWRYSRRRAEGRGGAEDDE